MKKYVILTYDIHPVGGTQAYTAGRVRWLDSKGWATWIFFVGNNSGHCDIPYLDKYLCGGFRHLPLPYHIDEFLREQILNEMEEIIEYKEGDEITVESHDDLFSYWGELLAEKVQGRHYVFTCNEIYRPYTGYRKTYVDNLAFFKFKYLRKELIASKEVIHKLFNGYSNIRDLLVEYPSICVEQDMVQEVENEAVEKIPDADWNIACIGRPEKRYMDYVIRDLEKFSISHPDKTINIVIVGNINNALKIKGLLDEMSRKLDNVNVVYLGVLSPVPRLLFDKMDVVIAAAQTAQLACYEDVFVITANVVASTTPGVLGYDTQDSWFGGNIPGRQYFEVLEDVLVLNKYKDKTFSMPEHHSAEYYYEEQWPYLELAEEKKEYYTDKFKHNVCRDYMVVFPFWLVKQNSNVLIYGGGMVGQDYLKQIGDYCNVVGVIDANADKFDDMVLFPDEGLRTLNYDYVVLAILDFAIAEEMKRKVLEYFADESKIIYQIKRAFF